MGIKSFLVALAVPALTFAAPQFEVQIVGGTPASAGDFPFIVSLQRSGSHFCGGSLLNANTVITAAHCTVGQTVSQLRVRAGSLNKNSGGTLVSVSSVKVHPNFSSSTLDSDIAIWKLATPIPASSTVGYATLPASGSDPVANSITTTAGWGALTQGGSSPTVLYKVDVPVISRTSCQASYGASSVTTTMFCAGLTAGGKDSCQGDSGGPIVEKSTKVLIGTVSWGNGCAQPNNPGVYARLGSLIPFITANL